MQCFENFGWGKCPLPGCAPGPKNRDEYKQSDCIKARNHMLLVFLHLSRNRYVFFRNAGASKCFRWRKRGANKRYWWV